MSLTTGSKLGPYEILGAIGAGGMGEVYRARDTRLDRTVAIKVLPPHLADDIERRQRFEREARAVSSLSHPNICPLFDIGQQDGVDYLVMEHLEGETVADRLRKGAIPAQQLLQIGTQVADALEKAHRQGVIHRDLKPGNIMLTKSGAKLLDFGLAKSATANAAVAGISATLTHAQPLTAEGTLIGTFQYMAPEQLEGGEADARSDIFALGAVLYEMATGRAAFSGKNQASVIAAILERDPAPISSIQPMTPPALDRVVKTCLAKDPEQRWQTAHDVKLQLEWIAEGGSQAGLPAPVTHRRRSRERLSWAVIGVLLAVAATFAWLYWDRVSAPVRPIRAVITPAENLRFEVLARNGAPAISPDGTKIAFIAYSGSNAGLWVRSLDSLEMTRLPDSDGAYGPFWSPDSRSIGFFANGKLRRVTLGAGPPQTICDADDARGATWGPDGTILFANSRNSPIYAVSGEGVGGEPTAVTKVAEAVLAAGALSTAAPPPSSLAATSPAGSPGFRSHRWPSFMPDGKHFVYVASPIGTETSDNEIRFASLDGKDDHTLLRSSSNAMYADGHLVYWREGALVAQPFDPKHGRLTGEPVAIADRVAFDSLFSHAIFSVSATGRIVYVTGSPRSKAELNWYDKSGKPLAKVGPPGGYSTIAVSPDGATVATSEVGDNGNIDIWLFDARGVKTRFTFNGRANVGPAFSPDAKRIFFISDQKDNFSIYSKPADGSTAEELVFHSPTIPYGPFSFSPDGRFMSYTVSAPKTKLDIFVLSLTGERKASAFAQSPFNELNGDFSPDGKWMVFQSDESGKYEIYVAPFPGPGAKYQVSTGGGTQPKWGHDGHTIFFIGPDDSLMAAPIRIAGMSASVDTPRPLFTVTPRNSPYDVYAVDAKGRILVNTQQGTEGSAQLVLVTDWAASLKR